MPQRSRYQAAAHQPATDRTRCQSGVPAAQAAQSIPAAVYIVGRPYSLRISNACGKAAPERLSLNAPSNSNSCSDAGIQSEAMVRSKLQPRTRVCKLAGKCHGKRLLRKLNSPSARHAVPTAKQRCSSPDKNNAPSRAPAVPRATRLSGRAY